MKVNVILEKFRNRFLFIIVCYERNVSVWQTVPYYMNNGLRVRACAVFYRKAWLFFYHSRPVLLKTDLVTLKIPDSYSDFPVYIII